MFAVSGRLVDIIIVVLSLLFYYYLSLTISKYCMFVSVCNNTTFGHNSVRLHDTY